MHSFHLTSAWGDQEGCEGPMIRYQNFEVHAQSPDGRSRTRTVRAANAEQAERMVKAMLEPSWTVYQFKNGGNQK